MSEKKPGVEISKRLVAVNAVSSAATRLVSVTALVWVNQYLLERLTPEEYAPFPVVAALVLFAQVFNAVFTGGVARFVTEAYARGEVHRVTKIVSSIAPPIFLYSLLVLVMGGAASLHVDALLEIDPTQVRDSQLMMGILVISQFATLLMSPFSVGIYVRQKFVLMNIIELGRQVLRLALMFALLLGVSTRVLWVVVATETAQVLGAIVMLIVSKRLLPELRFRLKAFDWATASQLASFGAWTMFGNLVYQIRTSSDALVLNKLGTALDVTAFHVGTIPDRQIDGMIGVAGATLEPALTAMHATNRLDALQRAYLRGNRLYLLIGLAVAAPLMPLASDLITLYVGDGYILAAGVILIVTASYPLRFAANMLHGVAMATARIRPYFVTCVLSGLAKVGISIVLVGQYKMGAVGAAWSTLAITVVTQIFFFWPIGLAMLRLGFRKYVSETLIPGWTPGVVSGVACYALNAAVPATSWLILAMEVAATIVAYVSIMLLTAHESDRADARRMLSKARQLLSGTETDA